MIEKFLPPNWKSIPQNQKSFAHSRTVANAAKLIASRTNELDPGKAYIYGLMHDLGKFYLKKEEMYKHPRVGYDLLKESHPDIAKICITHPFPDFKSYDHILHYHKNDEVESKKTFEILGKIEKDNYIELIQLCDKLSRLDDYVSLENKVKWYLETYNLDPNEVVQQYISNLTKTKQKFDKMTGVDVYSLLGIGND